MTAPDFESMARGLLMLIRSEDAQIPHRVTQGGKFVRDALQAAYEIGRKEAEAALTVVWNDLREPINHDKHCAFRSSTRKACDCTLEESMRALADIAETFSAPHRTHSPIAPGHTPRTVTADDDGTLSVNAPGFTTIRACIDCGVLMAGGPTRCNPCAERTVKDVES
jgi:hypothetical protein